MDDLAAEFSITSRQLRRVVEEHSGVTPIELAQTHRLLLAKRLLTDTSMPVTKVAYASGFQSVRRFDALFQERYRMAPSKLRRRAEQLIGTESDTITLTLGYRPPLAWDSLLQFLAGRATPGVEYVDGNVYARTVRMGETVGWVHVQPAETERKAAVKLSEKRSLKVELSASLSPVLMQLLARLRAMFDLDADPAVIESALAIAGLEELTRARPGLRVPGAIDGFELALRAVLGQQVSVKGATTLAGRFAEKFGVPIVTGDPRLTRSSADVTAIASSSIDELRALGVTGARAQSIHALANAVVHGGLRIEPGVDPSKTIAGLTSLPGIGDWTAQYIAMRALRWPDGFPASDLWLRRAAGDMTAAKLEKYSARWQPWRAYAAMHLWHSV